MPKIEDLIDRSSIGDGLRDIAFGKALRDLRLAFKLKASEVCSRSNIARGRLMEIESGAPPRASDAELQAIADAVGVPLSRIRALR